MGGSIMTPEQFANIVDIALIILFIVTLLSLGIAALVGYKKGIWASTYKMIFMIILVLTAVFSLNFFADFVGKFPLNIFGINSIIITNENSGISYVTEVTNLEGTLYDAFRGYYLLFNVTASASSASSFALAMATSVVKFITFLISMLLIITLGNLLIFLLWHIAFKRIIPKMVRKKTQLRWVGMIENMVTYLLCLFMTAAPLTALINTSNKAYQQTNQGASDGYVQYVDKFMDSYDNSLFAQVFFNWTVNDENLSLDAAFMDAITTSTFDNGSISLVQTLSELVEIASHFSNSILIGTEEGGFTFDTAFLTNEAIVTSLFDSLQSSKLISYVLPIAIDIALNIDVVSQYVDPALINASEMNWSEELQAIEDIYLSLLDSGFVADALDEQFSDPTAIVKPMLAEENYEHYTNVLKSIDNSKLLSRAIPSVIHKLVSSNEDAKKFFTDNVNELFDIKWGFELFVVYDSLYRLNAADERLVDAIFALTSGEEANKNVTRNGEETTSSSPEILEIIIDNIDTYQTILLGDTDKDNNLINVDENGRTIVYEDGKQIKGRYYRLFDLSIFKNLFANLDETLISMFGDSASEETKNDLKECLQELSNGAWKKNYKDEFISVFYTLAPFKGHYDSLKPILEGNMPSDIAELDDELIDCLTIALPRMDKSDVAACLLYPTFTNILDENSKMFEDFGMEYEIVSSGLEYSTDNRTLGKDIAPIISRIKDINSLSKILGNGDSANEMVKQLGEENNNMMVCRLLDTIYLNPILNYQIDENSKDKNYFNIINYVFSMIKMDGLTFFDSDYNRFKEETKNVQWENTYNGTTPLYDGENGRFCLVIKELAKGGIIDALLDENFFTQNSNFTKLGTPVSEGGLGLKELLYAMADSIVFSQTMGTFLDGQLEMVIDKELGVTFANVKDWKNEADALNLVLLSVGRATDFNINKIDMTSIKDVVALNDVLHALANSSIFIDRNTDEYLLGKWLYGKVQSALSSFSGSGYNIAKDPKEWNPDWGLQDAPEVDGDETYNILYHDFIYSDGVNFKLRDDWADASYQYNFDPSKFATGEYKHYYDNPAFAAAYRAAMPDDELTNLSMVLLYASQIAETPDLMEIPSSTLSNLLYAVNDTTCLRVAIYNLYSIAANELGGSQTLFDLSPMQDEFMLDCSDDLWDFENDRPIRDEEISYLIEVYDLYRYMDENGLVSSGSFDATKLDEGFPIRGKKAFKALNKSAVFHRLGPSKGTTTVFQNSFKMIFTNIDGVDEMIYSSSSPKDQDALDKEFYVDADSKATYLAKMYFPHDASDYSFQEVHIDDTFNLMDAIIGNGDYHGLKDKTGKLTFNIANLDFTDTSTVKGVEEVLKAMNKSVLFCDAVPNVIETALKNNDLGSSAPYINLDDVFTYYHYFQGEGNTYSFGNRYTDEDIQSITYLLEQVTLMNNNDPASDIPELDNITSIKDEDISGLDNFLTQISTSTLFHKAGVKKVYSKLGPVYQTGTDTTVFQEVVIQFLAGTDMKKMIYDSASPKDQDAVYHNIYGDAESKAKYLSKTHFPVDNDSKVSEEIDSLVGVLQAASKIPSFDFNTMDFSDNAIYSGVENLLLTMNDCVLTRDVVPNIVNDSLSSVNLEGASYINIKNTYVYYHYFQPENGELYSFENGKYSSEDIDDIMYLLKQSKLFEANDPTCEIPSFTNVNGLSEPQLQGLENFLNRLAASNLFHVKGHIQAYSLNGPINVIDSVTNLPVINTVFNDVIIQFIAGTDIKSIIFDHNSPKDQAFIHTMTYSDVESKANFLSRQYFPTGGSSLVSKEITDLVNVVRAAAKLTDFDFANMDFTDNTTLDNVKGVLTAMNNSNVFCDAVANIVSQSLSDVKLSEDVKYIKMEYVNTYYQYFQGAPGVYYTFGERYMPQDIDDIIYLLEQSKLFENNDPRCEIPSFTDITVFTGTEGNKKLEGLQNFLNRLADSYLFHRGGVVKTYNPNGAPIDVVDAETNRVVDTTVFQDTIVQFVAGTDVKSIVYNANSPKDIALHPDGAEAKAYAISKATFPVNNPIVCDNEIVSLIDVLAKASEFGSFNFASIEIATLDVDDVENLLISFNNSNLLYDCVPNLVYQIFNEGSFGSMDVKFNHASPFFVYEYKNVSFANHYPVGEGSDPDEIGNITDIMRAYKKMNTEVGDSHFNDINVMKKLINLNIIEDLMTSSHSSLVLHGENQYLSHPSQPTVFEDVVRYLFDISGTAKMIYDDNNHGLANVYDYMMNQIKTITEVCLSGGSIPHTGYQDSWDGENGEIRMFNIFLKDSINAIDSTGDFDFNKDVRLNNFSPSEAKQLMHDINQSDLVCEVLPLYIKTGFRSPEIGIFEKTYYPDPDHDRINYYLNQYQFGGTTNDVNTTEETEINHIATVLGAMATYDNLGNFIGYEPIGDFNLIDKGKLNSILTFIDESMLFDTVFTLENGMNATARGLLLHNSLEGVRISNLKAVSEFFYGGSKDERIRSISNVLDIVDYNPNYETSALYEIIHNTSSLDKINEVISSNDMTKLPDISDYVTHLLEVCYDADANQTYHRSYLTSQVLSYFLNDIVKEEETSTRIQADVTMIKYRFGPSGIESVNKDAYTTNVGIVGDNYFTYINKIEKIGLTGVLELETPIIDIFASFPSPILNRPQKADLLQAFEHMGTSKLAKIIYFAEIDGYLANCVDSSSIVPGLTIPEIRNLYVGQINHESFNFSAYGTALVDRLYDLGVVLNENY